MNLISTVRQSLTAEWMKFALDLATGLKRPKKIIQDDTRGGIKRFGSERVIIRNDVI